jgi:ABC-type cobalamin transport system ATPase subunit
VLLTKPSLLLLDEPHASLDADGQSLVDAIVRAALASGRSAVIASHDRDRTLELCGTALVLESGRVGFLGDSAELRGRGPVWVVGGNA